MYLKYMYVTETTFSKKNQHRTQNWPRPIIWDDLSSELVLSAECPCLTIIRKDKWYFQEGLVDFSASCLNGQVEIESNFVPCSKIKIS